MVTVNKAAEKYRTETKNVDFERKTLRMVVQEAFWVSRGIFWEKNVHWWIFSDFERKLLALWARIFQQGCQNCIPRVQRNNLASKKLQENWPFLDYSRKISGTVVKTAFYESSGTFWRKINFDILSHFIFFPILERKIWERAAEIFRRDFQKCILLVHRNNLSFLRKRCTRSLRIVTPEKKINLQRKILLS